MTKITYLIEHNKASSDLLSDIKRHFVLFTEKPNDLIFTTKFIEGLNEMYFFEFESKKYAVSFENTTLRKFSYFGINLYCDNVEVLEKIEEIIFKVKNNNTKIYEVFSDISAHYSREIYPLFNEFERLLKELMYLIFLESDLQHTEIKNMFFQKGNRQQSSKIGWEFIEGLTFDEYKTFLFDFNFSELFIKNDLEEFITKIDLSKYTNETLLVEIKKITEVKNFWDRYFKDKCGELIIDEVRESRNKVMHNKKYSKIDFLQTKQILEKNIRNLKFAIVCVTDENWKAGLIKMRKSIEAFTNMFNNLNLFNTFAKLILTPEDYERAVNENKKLNK